MITLLTIGVIIAQEENAPEGVVDALLKYGIGGIFIVLVAFGFFWAKPAVDQLKEDKTRAETQRDRLLEVYEEKIMPTMANAVDTLKDIAPVLNEVKPLLQETRIILEQIRRERDNPSGQQ